MDAAAFEQVYRSFRDFHAYFAPLFGRRETREHSGHYLQALLVQSGERRNAENLSETVPGSARGMQRFLTDSPWDDEVIIGRLQEYLGTRLEQPEGVWVLDGSDFPKQGRKSVGVARQYCGRLGKVANCQAGMFLAYVSPLGRALVDKGLYLPESWTSDKDRCEAAGVPEDRQGYRSKTELALEMVGRAQERGHLKAGWVAADDAFGMCFHVSEVHRSNAKSLSSYLCREARGHAATFSAPRGCDRPAGASPAKSTGPSTAGTGTAANPATTCPMLRRIPRWRPWHTWEAPVGV